MSWEYRVMKRHYDYGDHREEDEYAIYEVYFNALGEAVNISELPVFPHGETLKELEMAMESYVDALEDTVLDYDIYKEL